MGTIADLICRFDSLGVWARGGQRAPHKPLLVLIGLARIQNGFFEDLLFSALEPQLGRLLREFGPPRVSVHPEYPFWRLQQDGIWKVSADAPMESRKSNSDPKKSELIKLHARGGFTDEIKESLICNPDLISKIAIMLLEKHFPESIHRDILSSVGISTEFQSPQRRDPRFRQRVLTAYEYRCAICGFDVRLGNVSMGLDAAHIRWHQSGGPSDESNGLALCVMHHKAFDLGAFTIRADGIFLVSDQVNGTTGIQDHLLAFHGRLIRRPQNPEWAPLAQHIAWHYREVFRGDARYIPAS
jgi:putative restriction endonuclease